MDDLISRQQAIDGKILIQRTNGVEIYSDEAVPVEYLKNLPTIQPEERTEKRMETHGVCLDAISRQAALDAIDTWDKFGCDESGRLVRLDGESESLFVPYIHYEDVVNAIKGLPSVQPEPAIPLSWIENEIEWLKSLDSTFSEITAIQISAMVKKWRDEQDETD